MLKCQYGVTAISMESMKEVMDDITTGRGGARQLSGESTESGLPPTTVRLASHPAVHRYSTIIAPVFRLFWFSIRLCSRNSPNEEITALSVSLLRRIIPTQQ